jgi:hypothetical protein
MALRILRNPIEKSILVEMDYRTRQVCEGILMIYTIDGLLVAQKKQKQSLEEWYLNHLSNGNYLLKLRKSQEEFTFILNVQ